MWWLYVILYIIFAISFNQCYKIVTKTTESDGTLTVLLQSMAGVFALLLSLCFDYKFTTDWKVYFFLVIACIFYAISDRLNTVVRSGIEASTYSVLKQLSTVFMIVAGLLFFKEPFIWKKMIGAFLIVFSNILIFYKRGKKKFNKYILLGIISNIASSIALFLDVNLSEQFNVAVYAASTVLLPAFFISIVEKITISDLRKKFQSGNKKAMVLTSLFWGIVPVVQLRAYQLGDVTLIAPLCALTVIGNVIVGYLFLKERDNLFKKMIAAILIVISIILIKG